MIVFPLMRHVSPDAIVAYQGNRPIDAKTFLADVAALAESLPDREHIVNFCGNRYRFAVAMGAAMYRRQITLLLPNETPALLTEIAADYPEAYCFTDSLFTTPSMPVIIDHEPLPAMPGAFSVPEFSTDQIAAIVFTSGSTGKPVGNVKTWGALIRGARAAGDRFGMAAMAGAVVSGTVPHQHMYGFESTVLLPMQHGLAIDSERPFYPADICARIESLPRPRMLITTPIHLRALAADAGELPTVDFLLSATAPLTPQLAQTASHRFGTPLYEIYGCSEAGQVAMRCTAETDKWHCFDHISLRQDRDGTWAVCDTFEADVLLNDVIELHGSDRFLLHGRLADMVNVAGKRTSLAHLNYHLNSIAGVQDGVFIMPPEDTNGITRLMAFAVAPGMTAEAIVGTLRTRIDAAFLPRPLHLVTNLPRNATGKLPLEAVSRLVAGVLET